VWLVVLRLASGGWVERLRMRDPARLGSFAREPDELRSVCHALASDDGGEPLARFVSSSAGAGWWS